MSEGRSTWSTDDARVKRAKSGQGPDSQADSEAKWLTPEAAAEKLGVHRETVRQRILDGSMPAIEVYGPGDLIVTHAIDERDLRLFETRKVGRPRKAKE